MEGSLWLLRGETCRPQNIGVLKEEEEEEEYGEEEGEKDEERSLKINYSGKLKERITWKFWKRKRAKRRK